MYTIDKGYDGSLAETLNWTTEPPTQEGWYWATEDGGRPEVVMYNGSSVYVRGYEVPLNPKDFTYWLGPLPIPEPPQ